MMEEGRIEKELRDMVATVANGYSSGTKRNLSMKITALVRSVREDCAKVADYKHPPAGDGGFCCEECRLRDSIASAIRWKGK